MQARLTVFQCPLCQLEGAQHYHQDRKRDYWHCQQCDLVFVANDQRLTADKEKEEYDLHENSPDDEGYRQFLSRLIDPLQKRLPRPAKGLDFGCGPGPTLSLMMEEAGWGMAVFDSFYANNSEVLDTRYDFITMTEVIEHVFEPSELFPRLWQILKPEGYLAIMTKLVISPEAFRQWHYKNDLTHVCFYSKESMTYIAQLLDASVEFVASDVIIFQKKLLAKLDK